MPKPSFSTPHLITAAWLVAACAQTDLSTPSPPSSESPPPAPLLSGRLHKGLDISRHSGAVDWRQIATAGYGFAFAKATEGVDLKDSAFDDHWPRIKAAGLLRGAYHFYVTEDDPGKQADFFLATVALEPGDFAPVVDIEIIGHNTPSGLPERLQTFLDRLEAALGVKPILYTSPNFWNQHMNDRFGDYPLWIAEYEVEEPTLPQGWSTWYLWQYQGNATVSGVEKSADLNRGNPQATGLARLLLPESGARASTQAEP